MGWNNFFHRFKLNNHIIYNQIHLVILFQLMVFVETRYLFLSLTIDASLLKLQKKSLIVYRLK